MMNKFKFFDNRTYIDLYPVSFGNEVSKPLQIMESSFSQNFTFYFILNGETIFINILNKKKYHIKEGEGFLIPPNSPYKYMIDGNITCDYFWIEFNGLKTKHFLKQAGFENNNLIYETKFSSDKYKIFNSFNQLFNNNISSLFTLGQFFLFFNQLIESSKNVHINNHNDLKELYIREAINYIKENYSKAINISDLAIHCNLNRSYFCHLFKEQLTITPQQFLIKYRLSKACDYLKTTNYSLSQISEKVGYSNQFNFSAAFKKQYKVSPTEWRNKLS